MKRTGFKRKTPSERAKIDPRRTEDLGDDIVVVSYKKAPKKAKKAIKKNETKKLIKELVKLSHDFIRNRDSYVIAVEQGKVGGKCFDCETFSEGQQFQAGHWIPDSTGGAILRYHPQNMHGQSGGCNCKFKQEQVKINYTFAMIKKYGNKRVQELRQLKNKTIKADSTFYSKMIELYKKGDEQEIIEYLEQ